DAFFDDTDFAEAICGMTTFGNVDLRRAKGLDAIQHVGPSPVSIDTIIRSRGDIPRTFLRRCGVPDSWISDLPSLIGSLSPTQLYSCFISYSTEDEDFARRLYARIRQEGLRVWFAPN